MNSSKWLVPVLLLLVLAPLGAEDPDALFLQARQLPKARREEARALCRKALEGHPDYDEVRVYLGRLLTWDDRYAEARKEFAYVLERRPEDLDAREAAIDLEAWSDHPEAGLRLCDQGLGKGESADDAVLLCRKARLLRSLDDLHGAYACVQAALTMNPNLQPARLLREDLKEKLQRSKVGLDYTRDEFSQTFQPWNLEAVTLGHHFDFGTVLARATQAQRFGAMGSQFELEAYPHLFEKTYAFLHLGYSQQFMFPTTAAAADIYHNFPAGIEASLGFNYMDFTGSKVTVYSGSLGKYQGNALYTLRLNRTPSAIGASLSGSISGRWYQDDADTYGDCTVGTGFSPTQVPSSPQALNLRSRHVSLSYQKRLGHAWLASAGIAWEHQEYYPTLFQTHMTYDLGVEIKF